MNAQPKNHPECDTEWDDIEAEMQEMKIRREERERRRLAHARKHPHSIKAALWYLLSHFY